MSKTDVSEKARSAVCPCESVARRVKLYVVGVVDDPPKSLVVITPVLEFSEQFA